MENLISPKFDEVSLMAIGAYTERHPMSGKALYIDIMFSGKPFCECNNILQSFVRYCLVRRFPIFDL